MDNNLLRCDTLVALLLLAAVAIAGYRPPIGPLIKMHHQKNTFFALFTSEAVFCFNMDSIT